MVLLLLTATGIASAETVTVAVASNFAETARELAAAYEEQSGHEVVLIQGSTGKLHAQIVNGAPFDVFLSADVARAEDLDVRGVVADRGRFTYAIGQLALWSADPALGGGNCLAAMAEPDDTKIAIANPALAPYGLEAKRYLEAEGLWDTLEPRLVYGENVLQVMQFVSTGNARFGFVAVSQLPDESPSTGCQAVWLQPAHGLAQQAVLLERASDSAAARDFFNYLNGDDARARIQARGYGMARRPWPTD